MITNRRQQNAREEITPTAWYAGAAETNVAFIPAATPHDPAVDAMQQLARVLDRIGDALAAVDAPVLLAVETELVGVLAAMGAVTTVDDRAAARAASRQAAAALVRCRRLGASFSGVARALARDGRAADGYDCMGGYVERAAPVSVLVRA